MNSSELRIGNFVLINNPLHWPKLKGIHLNVIGVRYGDHKYFPKSNGKVSLSGKDWPHDYNQFDEFIDPITITEEWLLKFGLKQNSDKSIYQLSVEDALNIRCYQKVFSVWINDTPVWDTSIEYVHQLQNLYFALTGFELKYNP